MGRLGAHRDDGPGLGDHSPCSDAATNKRMVAINAQATAESPKGSLSRIGRPAAYRPALTPATWMSAPTTSRPMAAITRANTEAVWWPDDHAARRQPVPLSGPLGRHRQALRRCRATSKRSQPARAGPGDGPRQTVTQVHRPALGGARRMVHEGWSSKSEMVARIGPGSHPIRTATCWRSSGLCISSAESSLE
jgi:hypothetical protein